MGVKFLDSAEKRDQWAWIWYEFASSPWTASIFPFVGTYITTLMKQLSCEEYTDCHWCHSEGSCMAPSLNVTDCGSDSCQAANGWCCDTRGFVSIGPVNIAYAAYFAYLSSLSVVVQVLLLPLFGAIVDNARDTKRILFITTVTGSIFMALLYFTDENTWWLAGLFFLAVALCYRASSILYDSYLNFLGDKSTRTELSSRGFIVGFLGGSLFMGINMAGYILHPDPMTIRLFFIAGGVWWFGWSLITFKYMRNYKKPFEEMDPDHKPTLLDAVRQLWQSIKILRRLPHLWLFVVAAAMYNDCIMTFVSLVSVYVQEAIRFTPPQIAMLSVLMQVCAAIGSFGFMFAAKKWSDKLAILISLGLWGGLQVLFYFTNTFGESMSVVVGLGLALGGSQAVSRALFSKMIPKGYEAEMFTLYHLTQRGTAWIGPLVYGIITSRLNNNPRPGFLYLLIFLTVGFIFLSFVNPTKGEEDASSFKLQEEAPLMDRRSNPFRKLPDSDAK